MELKEFIGMEKPWDYNFEFESMKIRENFKPKENIFERFFTYKVMSGEPATTYEIVYPNAEIFIRLVKEKGYDSGTDCDNCSLFIRICEALWKDSLGYKQSYINKNKESIKANKGFGTDTMNSAITPLSKLAETLDKSEKAEPKGYTKSVRYLLECFLGENQKNFKKALEQAEKYIDSYHTLGNFVLVPAGFNKYRNDEFDDFWDKSLDNLKSGFNKLYNKYTKKYYEIEDYKYEIEDYKNVIFTFDKEQYCSYINMCFLWDCVKIAGNSYVSRPVGMENMSDKRDLSKFFEISVKIINRRGRFMLAMLVIQNWSPGLYVKINQFFDKERIIDGIDGAAKKILENIEIESEIPKKAKGILEKLAAEGKI